ncbi:C40 family peptidase [Sporosarcina sp. P20a]|uniref:C40 family peptidase n=1 Tax=Sporosarcina sp. P20a TaxID=2048256 RepID=UPI0013044FCA|nr:C40 family peptidase [Sporosarcina sp. P20a]
MNEKWMCAVSVATVWTDPDSPRVADLPALDHPVQIDRWLSQLSYEERLALSDKNQIQTQLLYGESVIVEEVVGDWARIIASTQSTRKNPRGYPGWVPLVQLSMKKRLQTEEFVRVTNSKAALFDESGAFFLRVSFNTIFPSAERRGKKIRVWTPHGWKLLNASDVERVGEESIHRPLTVGRRFIGLPYLWGGMSAWGFDCSGFIRTIWKACGICLPRDAVDQAEEGRPVSLDSAEWQKGDLIFFKNEEQYIHHVAMYVGNGIILHAPSTGKLIEQIELKKSAYAGNVCSVRRVI